MKTWTISSAVTFVVLISFQVARADVTEGIALGMYRLACTQRSAVWTEEISSMSELKEILHTYAATLTKADSMDEAPKSERKWVSQLLKRFDKKDLNPACLGLMGTAVALRKKLVEFAGSDIVYRFDYYYVPRGIVDPQYNKLDRTVAPLIWQDFGGGPLIYDHRYDQMKAR